MQRHPDSHSYGKQVDVLGAQRAPPTRVTGHRDGTVAHRPGHKRKLERLKSDEINVLCDPMLTRKSMALGEISHSCGILKMRKQGVSSYTEG